MAQRAQFKSFRQCLNNWDNPNNFLRLGFYKRYYGVIPVVTLVACDWTWIIFSCIAGFIRTDVVLSRNGIKSRQQGELTELLLHPRNRKFLTVYQTFQPNPELYDLYEKMKKAERNRK